MVQSADAVNLVPKNHVGTYDTTDAAIIGDGTTASNVKLATAISLAAAGGLEPTKDVKILSDDFIALAKQFARSSDGGMDAKVIR